MTHAELAWIGLLLSVSGVVFCFKALHESRPLSHRLYVLLGFCCVLFALVIVVLMGTAEAKADSLTWSFTNNSRYRAQIEFYDRAGTWAWPGHGQVYTLDDSLSHTFNMSCPTGLYICYGAWTMPNHTYYWGEGINHDQPCTNCCARCGGNAGHMDLNE